MLSCLVGLGLLAACVPGSHIDVTGRTPTSVGSRSAPKVALTPTSAGTSSGPTSPARGCPSVPRWAVTRKLVGVQFVSAANGWVLGTDRILATRDGGRHWSMQYRTTPAAGLRAIDFLDARHGWVIGAQVVLATSDGGRQWRRIAASCLGLRSVDFLGLRTAYAVSAGGPVVPGVPFRGGRLVSTRDGARHWRTVPSPGDVQTVYFATATRGWLGAGGTIYGTRDGGRTWTAELARGLGAQAVDVVAEVHCLPGRKQAWAELIGGAAMSQQAHIGYHYDGGRWLPIFAEQYFPHPGVNVDAESAGSYAGPVAAVSTSAAVFVDFCPACSTAVPHRARTWHETSAPMLIAKRGGARLERRGGVIGITAASAVDFVSGDNGWVVGTFTIDRLVDNRLSQTLIDRIVHTSDGGRSWRIQQQFRWSG